MNKHSRSSLFLMELILALLLFAITAAVCARLFTETHLREKKAKELRFCVTESQTLLAVLKSSSFTDATGARAALSKQFRDGECALAGQIGLSDAPAEAVVFSLYYDKDFLRTTDRTTAAYRISAVLSEENGMLTAQLQTDEVEFRDRVIGETVLLAPDSSTAVYCFQYSQYLGSEDYRTEQEGA